jgi:hypothetical protein
MRCRRGQCQREARGTLERQKAALHPVPAPPWLTWNPSPPLPRPPAPGRPPVAGPARAGAAIWCPAPHRGPMAYSSRRPGRAAHCADGSSAGGAISYYGPAPSPRAGLHPVPGPAGPSWHLFGPFKPPTTLTSISPPDERGPILI